MLILMCGGKQAIRHVKAEAKTNKQKLGFLGKFMHKHELPCMRIIKPTCAGKIMRAEVSAQKP